MSMREVLVLVDALLQDPTYGLAAMVDSLEGAVPTKVRSEFNFVAWGLRTEVVRQTSKPNVMLRPGTWTPNARYVGTNQRDARCEIVIGFETFHNELEVIQNELALVATAVARVMDTLVAYSAAHGGTVYDIEDPMQFLFGQFAGVVSNGFLATITLLERSTHE
jgi:hypothetical protein